jgi:putative Mg2+ transporter-C (MgtC) family protein
MSFAEPSGQGWPHIAALALAFALSALIGLEREIRDKDAGLRTNTIIGFTAALIMLVSKYGFSDVLVRGTVRVDPSRVVSHVVEGIGFIGGGLIFVRGESVRGLTTAASVWLTAAVGMACGAGLPLLAVAVTIGHFIVAYGFTFIEPHLPGSKAAKAKLQVSFLDGDGRLNEILEACSARFSVKTMKLERQPPRDEEARRAVATLDLMLEGEEPVMGLARQLAETSGIIGVETSGDDKITKRHFPRR